MEQTPPTRNDYYNVISVLYHALHGAETIGIYLRDAEEQGNERLADFFRELQATQREMANRASEMLGEVTPEAQPQAATDVDREEGATPGTTPQHIPSRVGDSPPDAPRADTWRPKRRSR